MSSEARGGDTKPLVLEKGGAVGLWDILESRLFPLPGVMRVFLGGNYYFGCCHLRLYEDDDNDGFGSGGWTKEITLC